MWIFLPEKTKLKSAFWKMERLWYNIKSEHVNRRCQIRSLQSSIFAVRLPFCCGFFPPSVAVYSYECCCAWLLSGVSQTPRAIWGAPAVSLTGQWSTDSPSPQEEGARVHLRPLCKWKWLSCHAAVLAIRRSFHPITFIKQQKGRSGGGGDPSLITLEPGWDRHVWWSDLAPPTWAQ